MKKESTKLGMASISYTGKMGSYQINDQRKYKINNVQKELLGRALYGLKHYDDKVLYEMNSAKKSRIEKVHKKTKEVLNLYKQEKIISLTNELFKNLFPDSLLTKELLDNSFTDIDFKCKTSIKDLNINKDLIIDLLMSEKILPSNYHEL
jgi:hypothetical protein